MKLSRYLGRGRRGVASILGGLLIFVMLFTIGTGYFIFVNSESMQYSSSLNARANAIQGANAESLTVTGVILSSNGHIGFYVNDTSAEDANVTAFLVLSAQGSILQCAGKGLSTGFCSQQSSTFTICANSACSSDLSPQPYVIVNGGRGSQIVDTGYTYATGTETLRVLTARGNVYSTSYPSAPSAVQANTAQSITVNPQTFKWQSIQPNTASLVQSNYNSNCNSASCALSYSNSVTAGNTLIYGLGWYGTGPPATPTDTLGDTFTLGVSNSVTYTPAPTFVQSRYTSNCGSSSCALGYSSSVTSGDTLIYGLGWYGQSPPSTPTDTLGDSFTLGVSNSVTYTPPTPALVQSNYNSNCNNANCALAYSNSVTAGNTLIYGLGWYGNQPYVPVTVMNCQSQPSLSLDGSNTGEFSSTNSGTVSLTTAHSNDIIVVLETNEDAPNGAIYTVSSVTATGLTFTKLSSSTLGSSTYQDTEVWWALASSPLSSATITVTLSGSTDDASLVAFGVSGANTSTPWDTNGAALETATGTGGQTPTVSGVSTSNANDMLLGFQGNGISNNHYGSTVETAGTGYTLIQNVEDTGGTYNDDGAAEYEIVSATQSSVSVAFGTSTGSHNGWMMIGDAIQQGTVCNSASTALDGSTGSNTESSSTSASLTTSNSNDVIILSAGTSSSSASVSSVSDSGGHTWTRRATETGSSSVELEEWYTIATSPLSSDSITVTWSGSGDNTFEAFGISGANTASPFDTNSGLAAKATGTTTSPSVSVSTSNANDMIFGLLANEHTSSSSCHTETDGSGFTDTGAAQSCASGSSTSQNSDQEYEIVSSTQTNLAVSFTTSGGGSNQWAMIGDAVEANPGTATPTTFQQMVTWDPATYTSYEATNLGNVRFCATISCSTELYAWLESCSSTCSTSGSTSTSATAWVKLTSSIAAGGSLTIYMVFQPTSTNFDDNYWGEAPNLSSTYGQYDNGANVFYAYGAFQGSSLPSTWSLQSGSVASFVGGTSNTGGVRLINNVGGKEGAVVYSNALTTNPIIVEVLANYNGGADDIGTGFYSSGPGTGTGAGNPAPTSGYYAAYEYYSSSEPQLSYNGGNVATASSQDMTTSGDNYLYTQTIVTGSSITMQFAEQTSAQYSYDSVSSWTVPVTYITTPSTSHNELYIGAADGGTTSYVYLYATRTRAYPPNGVMPITNFGSLVQGVSPSTPTDTLGDSFTLGVSNSVTASSLVNYYSYIWYATAGSSASDTITAAFPSTVTGTISIYEIKGYTTTGTLSSTGSSSAGSTTPAVSSFTPSSNSFVVGNTETASSSSTFTAGSGYTLVASCSSVYGCSEYQLGVGSLTTVPMTLGASAAWVESAISFAPQASTTYYSYIWYATAKSSSADTITASFSQSVTGSVSIYEERGVTATGLLTSTGSSSSASSSSSVSSFTPSANSFVVGNTEGASTTFTAGSGYTLVATCSSVYGCSEYQTAGGSSITVPMTLSPSVPWVESAIAFPPVSTTYYSYIWYATATSSGTNTITASFSQSVAGSESVYEINGYLQSFISTSTLSSSTASATSSVTSFTPYGSSIVVGNAETPSTSFTAGSGFTLVGSCSSVYGCSEYETGVSSSTTASMGLSPSAPWVEVAIAFGGAPAFNSGALVGGFPIDGVLINHALAFRVQFTNQDPKGRSVTLWPKSLAALQTIMQETVEITPFFIVDGISTDGTSLVAYSQPYITIPYKATVTVYFGATQPLGTGTDNIDQTEIAPFTGFFALEGQYSDGTLFGLTVPYPAGMATESNAQMSPTAGSTGTTVTVSCTTPCYFSDSAPAFVGWLDSTGKLTSLTTFTTTSSGAIPSGVTFQVPTYAPGYYTVMVSDYINTYFLVFQHT